MKPASRFNLNFVQVLEISCLITIITVRFAMVTSIGVFVIIIAYPMRTDVYGTSRETVSFQPRFFFNNLNDLSNISVASWTLKLANRNIN